MNNDGDLTWASLPPTAAQSDHICTLEKHIAATGEGKGGGGEQEGLL